MGYRLEPDKVREIAMELMSYITPWEYGGPEDAEYLKTAMYYTGVMEMAREIIKAIEELKHA